MKYTFSAPKGQGASVPEGAEGLDPNHYTLVLQRYGKGEVSELGSTGKSPAR